MTKECPNCYYRMTEITNVIRWCSKCGTLKRDVGVFERIEIPEYTNVLFDKARELYKERGAYK